MFLFIIDGYVTYITFFNIDGQFPGILFFLGLLRDLQQIVTYSLCCIFQLKAYCITYFLFTCASIVNNCANGVDTICQERDVCVRCLLLVCKIFETFLKNKLPSLRESVFLNKSHRRDIHLKLSYFIGSMEEGTSPWPPHPGTTPLNCAIAWKSCVSRSRFSSFAFLLFKG